MMNCVAIYLRLSQEDVDKRTNQAKDDSNSIVAQRQLILRYLDSEPSLASLPRIEFCDDGFSGTNFSRPDFQRMIDLIRAGEISTVVVKDLSRFGRDYLEVGDYLEHIFPFLGIRMISINDHYDSNKYTGSTPGMDVAFQNLIYDYYSKDLSKKVKTGMRVKQRQGGYVSCCLYGYKVKEKHKMVIDPETAPIVRRIFMDVIVGKSTSQVARELNAEGVPTPLMYKNIQRKGSGNCKPVWTHQRIIDTIRNLKYTGCMVNHTRESRKIRDKAGRRVPQEEWYIHENTHEAIVSKEEFEAAGNALRKVRPYKKKENMDSFPLYCTHCGRKLQRTFGLDDHFYCATPYWSEQETACKAVRWDRTKLEEVLLEALKAQLSVMEVEARKKKKDIEKDSTRFRSQLKMLNAELKQSDAQRIQSYMNFKAGTISREEFLAGRAERDSRQAELKANIAAVEARYEDCIRAENERKKEQATTSKAGSLDDEALKEVLYDAIEKVNITDGEHIEILWKFNDLFEAV